MTQHAQDAARCSLDLCHTRSRDPGDPTAANPLSWSRVGGLSLNGTTASRCEQRIRVWFNRYDLLYLILPAYQHAVEYQEHLGPALQTTVDWAI